MNLPTKDEIEQQIMNAIYVFEEIDSFGCKYAPNFIDMEQTVLDAMQQDYAPEVGPAMARLRQTVAGTLTPDSVRSVLDPMVRTYGKILNSANTDPVAIWRDIYDYYASNGYEVISRGLSFGSITAGTNSGTGTINRLTKDEWNYTLQEITPETKNFKVIQDQFSGANKHEEIFLVEGSARGRDLLELSNGGGSGIVANIAAVSARNSIVRNASFSQADNAATPTVVTSWTINTIANVALDQTNYYRDFAGDTTPASLKISNNITCEQLLSTNNIKLDPARPYYLQLAYNREIGTGDGTLTIQLGNTSKSVTLTAQTGWNILRLDLDSGLWFKNFNKQALSVKITYASHSTGYILIDDVICVPMSYVDGSYWTVVGGATPFLRDDSFTVADTDGTTTGDGLLSKWLWRAYGLHLPTTTSSSASTWNGDV